MNNLISLKTFYNFWFKYSLKSLKFLLNSNKCLKDSEYLNSLKKTGSYSCYWRKDKITKCIKFWKKMSKEEFII
jgi:hypothetical protein